MFSGQLIAQVPFFYEYDSTAFEYDENGLLLGYYIHTGDELYNCVSIKCKYVEFFHGVGASMIDEYHNKARVVINPNYDYRFYVKQAASNTSTLTWMDVTGTSFYTIYPSIQGPTAVWAIGNTNETMIRSNKKFYLYTFKTMVTDGLFEFNINTVEQVNNEYVSSKMQIPMGELDIFLNGHYLIENLDYYLDFPRVVITTKDYFKGDPITKDQEVVIRFSGLCDKQLNKTKPYEFGFIRNDVVSNNKIYNIRDDKVISIFIKGSIYLREELQFNENNPNFNLFDKMNGYPYLIKDTIAPIKSIVKRDVYDYKKLSIDVDKKISDYLTIKIPEVEPVTLNPILDYHNVFSPFICKILFDLKHGILDSPLFQTQYNDDQLRTLIAPYLSLIKLDPTYVDNESNRDFIRIHPHHLNDTVSINAQQYVFLNRVVKLYCRDLIDLSASVLIV